jgi:spermidine synthase
VPEMTDPPSILEIANPFTPGGARIRLLEPPDADRAALAERLVRGTYDKPFIAEDGTTRALHFCWRYTQSRMRIDEPVALQMPYTRMMMSFLLFHTNPCALLLLGLGGGSLAKYCHRHLPKARIVVVESNRDVLAFRDEFAVPPDDERFRVVEGDARAFVGACRDRYDAVLMDAFDRRGLASGLDGAEFYEDVRSRLYANGVLVANVAGLRLERRSHIETMQRAWGDDVLVLPVEEDDNDVVFAFCDPTFEPRWRWIDGQAEAMRRRYGIEFPTFARRLKRSSRERGLS